MDYEKAKEVLLNEFEQNSYKDLVGCAESSKKTFVASQLANGTQVEIVYPGYKSTVRFDGSLVYDYRVDIRFARSNGAVHTFSHAHIIVDLACKVHHEPAIRKPLTYCIYSLFHHGLLEYDLEAFSPQLRYPPDKHILKLASIAHEEIGKKYDKEPNLTPLTYDELFHSMLWIALQEDINYPMPRYEGRRMPFARYLEAIWSQKPPVDLANVIKRALEHTVPSKWNNFQYP